MRRRDIIAATALIVGGAVYGYLAWRLPERSLPNTPGPPFFPLIVATIILALSAALLFQALSSPDDSAADNSATTRDSQRLAYWALAAFLGYIVLLPTLGFIAATIPFFALLMVLFGEHRPHLVAVGAVAATVILYAVFRHGFGIFLPRGLLAGIVA
jgi:hypothetical protein